MPLVIQVEKPRDIGLEKIKFVQSRRIMPREIKPSSDEAPFPILEPDFSGGKSELYAFQLDTNNFSRCPKHLVFSKIIAIH